MNPADPVSEARPNLRSRTLSPAELLRCVRSLEGWVAPNGPMPRAALDRLVELGVLEAWPGRPLYRARPGDAS